MKAKRLSLHQLSFSCRGLSAAAALFAANSAHGAAITWGSASTVAADTDVSTIGAFKYAEHWGGTNNTINGVTFSAAQNNVFASGAVGVNSDIGSPSTGGLSSAYLDILKGNWYNASSQTATLTNLTSGHQYQSQVWAADGRYGVTSKTTITGGPDLLIKQGQYAKGTFVADATSQSIAFTGDGVVNAIQVRDISASWSGTTNGTWADSDSTSSNFSGLNFTAAKAQSTVAVFGDTTTAGGAVSNYNLTVGAGGASTGTVLFENTTAQNYTIASADANGITGTTAVYKNGTGKVTFSGTNTYAGATTISGGTLKIASTGSITHTAQALSLTNSTSRLDIASGGSASFSMMNSVNSSQVNIAGNWTGNAASGSQHNTLAGTYTQTSGTGSLLGLVTGNASGDVTSFYLGGTSTLGVGKGQFTSLQVGGRGTGNFAVSGSAALNVTGDANPAANNSNQLVVGNTAPFSSPTAGTRRLIQQGGSVTANGLQLGGGSVTVTDGIYYLNGGTLTTNTLTRGSNAASTGTLYFGGGTFKSGTAFSTDANVTTTINSGGATIDTTGGNLTWSGALAAGNIGTVTGFSGLVGGSGYTPGQMALTFSAPVSGTTATGYAVVDQGGTVTDIIITNPGSGYTSAPSISGFTGGTGANATAGITTAAGGLTKSGAGTLTLSGTNSYTGTTAVSGGKLLINGNNSAATGAVTVASGATLGGTGTVGGATTIQSGGHLAVGNSPGTQTFSSTLTFDSGSIFDWELDASTTDTGTSNQGTYDKVVANGAVTGTSAFTIALGTNAYTDVFWNTNKSWSDIFTGTGSFDLAGIFTTINGAGIIWDSENSRGNVDGQGYFTMTTSSLNWSAVPEPTSALAGLLIAAGLLRRRRA